MNFADVRPRTRGRRFSRLLLTTLLLTIASGSLAAAASSASPNSGAGAGSTGLDPVAQVFGTIAPGVHVGTIDLSGMDETGARAALTQAFASVGTGQITVAANLATTTITYASIGRHVDIDALIQQAFAAAGGTALTPTVVFDQAGLTQTMNQIAANSATPAANPRAIRTTTGFAVQAGQPGRTFDAAPVLSHLIAMLQDPATPSQIAVALAETDTPAGTDATQAQAAVAGAIAMSIPIVLANGGQTWTIPQNVVHSWISFAVVNGAIQIVVNDALVQKALTALAPKINRQPVSASWAYGPHGVTVVPALNGRTVDVARTSRRIEVFLQGRAAGTVTATQKIGPTVTTTEPKLTTAEAQQQSSKFKLLSTWTTYFQPASHNGFGANIWVPAGYLDNQVVQPGATFSFWDRVGPVTLARGYKLGGAIVNGHTEEGVAIGGGICSTSTTLFNAALRAGLKIGERSNHYYYITRYPVGLDATVSKTSGGGEQDMTFTNDTPYPILIKSFKTSGSVTFSLYGIPTGRTVTFSKPVITNYTKATSTLVPVSTLPTGRVVRIEYPDDGFNASVTAFVRDASGKLISNRTYFSHYGTVQGVQYIGSPTGAPLTVPSYAPGAQGG
jgi:vancomycin resistance protein YoaR